MSALTERGLPVFGSAAPFLTSDGRHVFRIGSGTTGLAIDGEMVYGLPAVVSGGKLLIRLQTEGLFVGSAH